MKTIYLAGGCFWGLEKYYNSINGVISTEVGYANGTKDNPSYQDLKSHLDDASETVKIIYDEKILSIEKILEFFLRVVDPYSINKQGEDEGLQYRSGIYYLEDKEKDIIKNYLDKNIEGKYAIEILPLRKYFKAEEYHQNYLDKNPGGYCHIDLSKLRKSEKK